MQADDEKAYLFRQIDASICPVGQGSPLICFTTAIGREGLVIRGGGRLPIGSSVELTLYGDHRTSLVLRCVVEEQVSGDQYLRYLGLSFEDRARLEELMRPHWDGVDLLDGLTTMACLYGATTLKDWLCMTTLLQRLQPHLLNRKSSLA